jgi:hypothetical protein
VLEVRDERTGYLKVYDHRRERGGYVKIQAARAIRLEESAAPALLAVLRFLCDSAGSEALGISYGAAYLKAAPADALTAEPLDAIAGMAERLADAASGNGDRHADVDAHLEVVAQLGVRMHSFDRNGHTQVCYDGELYREVLTLRQGSSEERAHAALGLTRPDCIDPGLGALQRALLDEECRELLEGIEERSLSAMMRSRLHARRAAVWAGVAYEQARRGQPAATAAQRAVAELMAVHPQELGDDHRAEHLDALLRVGAVRWAAVTSRPQPGPLILTTEPGKPGETCVALAETPRPAVPLLSRCTYGIVWTASAQSVGHGQALVLAVQPLASWRELWVFHETAAGWTVDVLSPGADDPEEGYVEFAGFTPGTQRLLIVREVKDRGRFRRRFEELRLEDLIPVKQASSPELLADFGRWQDATWRRDTLALH